MGKISLVCPSCRTKLSFNEVPGYQEKIIQCPHCQYKAKASVYQSGCAAFGGHGASDDATEIGMQAKSYDSGQIRVVGGNQICKLKVGTNVIGRIAKSGTADIQITHDEYMSRRHLQIDVVKTQYGFEHRLVEINSKNMIVLNGKKIDRGDILKLKFGDRMILGKTEVVFEETDEEATQLD